MNERDTAPPPADAGEGIPAPSPAKAGEDIPAPSPAKTGEDIPAPSPADAGEGWGEGARTGGCLCGAVRFRIGLPALWVAHCHCSMCRRAQGAGFVTWAGIAEQRFVLDSGADVLRRFRSSPASVRSFCGRCGSPLLFQSSRWPGEIHVTLASLDDPAGLEPQVHAYWSSRAAWADWSGRELPKVEPEGRG